MQVAIRPSPSQKLAISFIHTQRVLAELHGVQTASSSKPQNVDGFMYCFNKSYIKIRGADAVFHRAELSICTTQCWGFMVDLINKPVYICEALAVRRLCKSMIVMFGDSPLSLSKAPSSSNKPPVKHLCAIYRYCLCFRTWRSRLF